jgi:type IV pilus assembly protein PilE
MNSAIQHKPAMRRVRGLTLVELMVVVAVMAIVATIAYPMYTNQVQKARRADAKVALESIALAQERYFTIFGSYGTLAQLNDPNGDGSTADSMVAAVFSNLDRNNDGTPDNYAVAVTATTTQFTLTATRQGAQANDSCDFELNHLGERTPATGCW